MEQMDREYDEWTESQKLWLDNDVPLFSSPRGRKPKTVYDNLYFEREMARLSDRGAAPSYTQQASKAIGGPVSPKPEDEDPARQRYVRASQRRKNASRVPAPPKR